MAVDIVGYACAQVGDHGNTKKGGVVQTSAPVFL